VRFLPIFVFSSWLLLIRASTHLVFIDVTSATGIQFTFEPAKTSAKYLIEAMGGGVAIFDADGDGRMDLFFTNGAALRPGMTAADYAIKTDPRYWNRLYLQQPNGAFKDTTEGSGLSGMSYSQGAAVGDCDNDGRPDLFVTGLGVNTLFRNLGDGHFRSSSLGSGWSTSAGFIDFDRDGLLDLFVARYLNWDFGKNKPCGGNGPLQAYCHPNEFAPTTHLLFRNTGGCKFEDISEDSGLNKSPGKGLGVAFADIDHDGWPDIAVANDSYPQQLFRNRHDGTFEETALASGLAYDEDGKVFAGMGIDLADYDNDSWPDAFINALANQGYSLFRNRNSLFEHRSASSGINAISRMHSGWGTKFIDFDNDGWKDLFVSQSHVMDNIELTQPGTNYKELPLLMRNVAGKFMDVSAKSGLGAAMAARGAAFGDLNNDGAIDIVVSALSSPARVYRNTSTHNWLMIQTLGTKSNRDGIGASVRITPASGPDQFGFVSTAGSYLSSHDKRLHFGLGTNRQVKLIEIKWPSGIVQTWTNVPANQLFLATEAAK